MPTYRLDYPAFRRHVLNADWMEAEMLARAGRMKAFAEAIAPFDPGSTDGTHYKDSFTVDVKKHGGVRHDRVQATLSNTDAAAFYIEFGTGDTPEFAVLRKALDAG